MNGTHSGTPDPYVAFAGVYDQDCHVEISAAFFRRIRPLILRNCRRPHVLDLGCGTGLLSVLLARAGCTVTGVDRNPRMIDQARRRCRGFGTRTRFVRAHLDALPARLACDAAVACGDVVNHIGSARELSRVFAAARQCSRPRGLLVFDSLNLFCFERYWADQTYYAESPRGDLVMECDWDPRRKVGLATMVAYEKNRNGSFVKRVATLTEKLYTDDELERMLKRAGFRSVRSQPWSPWPDQHREPGIDRSLWVART